MYLKYFLESGIFAQDSKDSESCTLFYFVTDPSVRVSSHLKEELTWAIDKRLWVISTIMLFKKQ